MRRLLALLLATLGTAGAGIAHEAGAFAEHAHPPAKLPPIHPGPHFPPGEPAGVKLPPPGPVIPPAGQVEHDADVKNVKKILCEAYDKLYDRDTNSVQVPSLTSLAESELPRPAADRIRGILEKYDARLQSVKDGDFHEVFADFACTVE